MRPDRDPRTVKNPTHCLLHHCHSWLCRHAGQVSFGDLQRQAMGRAIGSGEGKRQKGLHRGPGPRSKAKNAKRRARNRRCAREMTGEGKGQTRWSTATSGMRKEESGRMDGGRVAHLCAGLVEEGAERGNSRKEEAWHFLSPPSPTAAIDWLTCSCAAAHATRLCAAPSGALTRLTIGCSGTPRIAPCTPEPRFRGSGLVGLR